MFSMGYWAQRAINGMGAGLLLGLLASCGGGTDQVDPFEPTRYMAFGDAMSVITPEGLKYTVNAVGSDGITPDCSISTSSQPSLLWTQILGNTFNFAFKECNPSGRTKLGEIFAKPDAKSADFVTQALRSTGVIDAGTSVAEVERDRIGEVVGLDVQPRTIDAALQGAGTLRLRV